MKRHFTKKDIQMANEHMTRCSSALAIRKVQIKIWKMRINIPVRMADMKYDGSTKC